MASFGLITQTASAQSYANSLGTGSLVIYSGTAPANAKTALSGNTVLATHTMAGFTVSGGTVTANAIADATITATGTNTPTFIRILVSGVAQYQENVGSGVTLSDPNYVENGTSKVNSLVITVPSE
jgi:hypothetical protein